MEFNYTTNNQDGILIFKLKGRLMDVEQSTALMSEVTEKLDEGQSRIVFDLDELDYMNSTGLNNLVSVLTKARNKGGDALICNVSAKVKELFIVTKLNTVFTVTDTLEEAINQLKSVETN